MASKIPTREIGKTGVKVGQIGLGCMSMCTVPFGDISGSNPDVPVEPWFELMKKSIEMGCNFFNTGEFYGDNEIVLRDFFKKYPELRDEVFISVKAGIAVAEGFKPIGTPDFIKSNIDFNLNKLGVKKIDLYEMARVDPQTPVEITIGAIAECIKEGKVGHIGLSEASADTIRRAHKVHPIACVEVEYSLWSLDIEKNDVMKTCEELGIGIIAYSPLGRGFLAGKFQKAEDAKHTYTPRIEEHFDKNVSILKSLEALAEKHKVTPAQLSIAWLLKQSPLVIPIPGTSKIERMISNVEAANVKLSDEDAKEIRDVVCSQEAVGGRYPEAFSSLLFGSTKAL